MDMTHVPLFKTLINHEQSSQDCFQVLYAMLCVCHPRLLEKLKIEAPTVEPFFHLSENTTITLNAKKSKQYYTDMEQLTFVIDTLDSDGHFEKALNIIRIQKIL